MQLNYFFLGSSVHPIALLYICRSWYLAQREQIWSFQPNLVFVTAFIHEVVAHLYSNSMTSSLDHLCMDRITVHVLEWYLAQRVYIWAPLFTSFDRFWNLLHHYTVVRYVSRWVRKDYSFFKPNCCILWSVFNPCATVRPRDNFLTQSVQRELLDAKLLPPFVFG